MELADASNASNVSTKPPCKYGTKCYRRNAAHLEEFSHADASPPKQARPGRRGRNTIADYFDRRSPSNDAAEQPAVVANDASPKSPQQQPAVDNNPHMLDGACVEGSCGLAAEGAELRGEAVTAGTREEAESFITANYGLRMPDDFFELWHFCAKLNPDQPADALQPLLHIQLVGPFDVLAGKCRTRNKFDQPPNYDLHWRFFYDVPEFQTVARSTDAATPLLHLGYFRDDPKDMPAFVAKTDAALPAAERRLDCCRLDILGTNLFAALLTWIDEREGARKSGKADGADGPKGRKRTAAQRDAGEVDQLRSALQQAAQRLRLDTTTATAIAKSRLRRAVCPLFHGAGLVVPVHNDVGYRPLPLKQDALLTLLRSIRDASTTAVREMQFSKLQELITLCQFANDEMDYGEGLELGLQVFLFGDDGLKRVVDVLLTMAYRLLKRDLFARIVEAHLPARQPHLALLSQFS